LFLLGDVIVRFENAFSISAIVSIEHPTADNYDLGAVLASVNEFATPAASRRSCSLMRSSGSGNSARSSSWVTRLSASSRL
jgi:hypothetical protein